MKKDLTRLLILNYEFPPVGGGAGNATSYLVSQLQGKSVEVHLVASSPNRFQIKDLPPNVKLHLLDIGKKNKNLRSQSVLNLLSFMVRSYFYCKKLDRNIDFDLVHAFFGIPCGMVAMLLGKPFITSLRGSDVPGHNPKFRWIYSFTHPFIRRIWRKSSLITANSDDLRKEAKEFYSNVFIRVIPNGVDTNFFKTMDQKKPSSTFRILYVGRFHEVKNLHLLLNAFREFVKRHPDSELHLVGDGKLKGFLEKIAQGESKIKIHSGEKRSELRKKYQESDLFVLPSINEGMSNCALEAMACGLPLILTETGGAHTLIRGNGYVVKKNSEKEIFERICFLYEHPEKRIDMGKKSRLLAEQFTWQKCNQEYLDSYEDVLGFLSKRTMFPNNALGR